MMTARRCSHKRKVTGIVQTDVSRTDGNPGIYTLQFSVTICTVCGHTDFYCQSHKAVCEWLAKTNQPPVQ